MKIKISGKKIKKFLPSIYERMKLEYIKTFNQIEDFEGASPNIDFCKWLLKIDNYEEVQEELSRLDKKILPEERLYQLMKSNKIDLIITAKQKPISISIRFPKSNSNEYFIPEELLNSLFNNFVLLNNPSIFLYESRKEESSVLSEYYVLGGLKHTTDNSFVIALQKSDYIVETYKILLKDKTLVSESFWTLKDKNFLNASTFTKVQKITLDITYETVPVEEAIQHLKGIKEWIQDPQSHLHAMFHNVPDEMLAMPAFQRAEVYSIPPNTPKIYLNTDIDKIRHLRLTYKIK